MTSERRETDDRPAAGTDRTPGPAPQRFEAETLDALTQLHEAADSHGRWLKAWHGRFIYRHPMEPDDLAEDAHRRCVLGRWYYAARSPLLVNHPAFAALGTVHEEMHDLARNLGRAAAGGVPVEEPSYERFMDKSLSLAEHIRALQVGILWQAAQARPLAPGDQRRMTRRGLEQECSRFERTGQPCCVVRVDLDHRLSAVETTGQPEWRQILGQAGTLLAAHLRPYDSLFHFGDKGFLLCMPHTDPRTGRGVCERLEAALTQTPIHSGAGPELRAAGVFGIAWFVAGLDPDGVLERAEQALRSAREERGGRVALWSPDMA